MFDGYLGLAILHLRKVEVWHHVVIFAEMLMAVGLINGQEILLRASQSVPTGRQRRIRWYPTIGAFALLIGGTISLVQYTGLHKV